MQEEKLLPAPISWEKLPNDLIQEIANYSLFPGKTPAILYINKWWHKQVTESKKFKELFSKTQKDLAKVIEAAKTREQDYELKIHYDPYRISTHEQGTESDYYVYHHQRNLLTSLESLQKRILQLEKLIQQPLPTCDLTKRKISKKIKTIIRLINDAQTQFDIKTHFKELLKSTRSPIITNLGLRLRFLSSNTEEFSDRKSVIDIKKNLNDKDTKEISTDLKTLYTKTRIAIKVLGKETRQMSSKFPNYFYTYESMAYCHPDRHKPTKRTNSTALLLIYELLAAQDKSLEELQIITASRIHFLVETDNLYRSLFKPIILDPPTHNKMMAAIFPKNPAVIPLYRANELFQGLHDYVAFMRWREDQQDYQAGNFGNLFRWENFFSSQISPQTNPSKKFTLYFFDFISNLSRPFRALSLDFKGAILPFEYERLKSKTEWKDYLPLLALAKALGADVFSYYQCRYGEKFSTLMKKKIELPDLCFAEVLRLQKEFLLPSSYQLIKLEVELALREYNQSLFSVFKNSPYSLAIAAIHSLLEHLNASQQDNCDKLLLLMGCIVHYCEKTFNHPPIKKGFTSFLQHKLNPQPDIATTLQKIIDPQYFNDDNFISKSVNAYKKFVQFPEEELQDVTDESNSLLNFSSN